MATFYVESYLAFSIPAIIIGFMIKEFGLIFSSNLYVIFIITLGLLELLFIQKLPKEPIPVITDSK
ncbi:hypothetical protein [Acinetobacter nosocomialis]|uniref:hypothetical protein n=1 Tax=Acinetobacter nosocomialis TaxID=106654 RepID=UPI0024DEA190|nr:hypothetical protein [Acinetobacter nosocomialis]